MATVGFELLHATASASFNSIDDAAVSAVHWNLVTSGLRCCGSGESWPEQITGPQTGSELLPAGWNADNSVYSMRYIDPTSDRKYLLKIVAMDGSLIVHLIRCFDEKTVSTSIRSRDFVNDTFTNYQTAFTNLSELNNQLTKELYGTLVNETMTRASSTDPKSGPSLSSPRQPPHRSPLMEDPRRGVPPGGIGYTPPRVPFGASPVDPFAVGRADLDPLAGGIGGGMFMDARNFPGRGGNIGPGGLMGPTHPGFPPGSIPPGARFDPIGPPGTRPNPDPDHERPPYYDDMFM